MSTTSYSKGNPIEREIQYLGRRLDKFCKFYWRGEDMWETYHTFIEGDGSAQKFVNGPSFSNEYSSPQYDHAMGNLTGVKFTRMQVSFKICSYGVTVEQYRALIEALGPYEIDYLAFDYDDKLCYLAKTTGLKEATKYVMGTNSDGEDLYLVENNLVFEVQGEQCALAQRQYVWTPISAATESNFCVSKIQNSNGQFPSDLLPSSEKSFGVVSETTIKGMIPSDNEITLCLFLSTDENVVDFDMSDIPDSCVPLCEIIFNKFTENWRNTDTNSQLADVDQSLSVKYDSASGLIFMQYGEADYKILNLLLTNTQGTYLIKDMKATKMKIHKKEPVQNLFFIWKCVSSTQTAHIDHSQTKTYGRAKAILM